MTDVIFSGVVGWMFSGLVIGLFIIFFLNNFIKSNVGHHFFFNLNPTIGILLMMLFGPLTVILPHIYYIPVVYRNWKAEKEKNEELVGGGN